MVFIFSLSKFIVSEIAKLKPLQFYFQQLSYLYSVSRWAMILILTLIAGFMISAQYQRAIPFKKEYVDVRKEFLSNIATTFPDSALVKVPAFRSANPTWFYFHDLTPDPQHYINKAHVFFWGLGDRKIIIEEPINAQ